MTADEVLANYLEAMRLGDTVLMEREDRVRRIGPDKIAGAPLFDFGYINDFESPRSMGQELYDSLWAEWDDSRAFFKLPYPEQYVCIEYDRWSKIYNLFFVTQDEDGTISLQTWFYHHGQKGLIGKWTLLPVEISFDPSRPDEWIQHWAVDIDNSDPAWLEERSEDAKTNICVALSAFVLLHRSGVTVVEGDRPKSVVKTNEKRERVKLDPIARPIVVRIEDRREILASAGAPTGITMRPHDRRGHWRTRKASGKRYWVRSCKINGGGETSPTYIVTH